MYVICFKSGKGARFWDHQGHWVDSIEKAYMYMTEGQANLVRDTIGSGEVIRI